MNKIILGSFVALASFGLIIYMWETDKSFLQAFIGFVIFLLPIMFISSFGSTVATFLLVFFIAFYSYFAIYKLEYYDTLFGLLLALIIGGSISYFRIHKYKLFSSKDYKEEAIKSKEFSTSDYKKEAIQSKENE